FEELRILRNRIARDNDLIHFQIFTQKALYDMCKTLPTTKNELLRINGMGKIRVEKYGNDILKVIRDYCDENDIDASNTIETFEEMKPKKERGHTKIISLELFKTGKSI